VTEISHRASLARIVDSDFTRLPGEILLTLVTLRLPDDLYQRLEQLAASRGISLSTLMEELCAAAIAAQDAEIRFRATGAGAKRVRALEVLDRLDAADGARAS
jgi:predicted transcriptional regulator